jgi:hypothetical protein
MVDLYKLTFPFLVIMTAGLIVVDAFPKISTFAASRGFSESAEELLNERVGKPESVRAKLRDDRRGALQCSDTSRSGHDAERADHRDPASRGNRSPAAFVDEQGVCVEILGQQDCGGFTRIEPEVASSRIFDHVDPICPPDRSNHVGTGSGVHELVPHSSWNGDPPDDGRQEVEPADASEVKGRGSVGDDDHAPDVRPRSSFARVERSS